MIGTVISSINTEVAKINILDNIYELASVVSLTDGKSAPAIYQSSGQYKLINWDMSSLLYHRYTDSPSRTSSVGLSAKGSFVEEVYQIKAVVYAKRFGVDTTYVPELTIRTIANSINFTSRPLLRKALNLSHVSALITGYEINSQAVWNEETNDLIYKVPSNFQLASIDYTITLKGRQSCFVSVSCD